MIEWKQTPKTITIQKTVGFRVNSKNVSSEITEYYVKMNVPDHKIFMHIDLFAEIDIETSKIVIEDKNIFIYLDKLVEDKWPRLEFLDKNNREEYNIKKPEVEERRKIGREKYEKRMKELEQIAIQQRKENEKYVIDKSLKIDDEKNKLLKEKKTEEKKTAENELYKFISDYGEREAETIVPVTRPIIREVTKEEKTEELKPTEEKSEIARKEIIKSAPALNNIINEIFEKTDIVEDSKTDLRQQSNIKVNLTEKAIPHFAARESLTKEPPFPKSKKFVPEKNMVINP
jgi:hypothetical protein